MQQLQSYRQTYQVCTKEMDMQEKFIHILHHDSRQGFVKIMKLYGNRNPVGYATKDYKSIIVDDRNCNAYITLNSFRKPNKDAENLYSINCLYFDLDLHCANQEYIDFCVENTLHILKKEYESKELPVPSMVTKTGRGLGLFYVLDRSIPNIKSSKNAIDFWKIIYEGYADSIRRILSYHTDVLELDSTSISDVSRIVRIPGTINQKNNRRCELIDIEGKYYSLRELYSYVSDYIDTHNDRRKKENSAKRLNKIISIAAYKQPYLRSTIIKLERLQANYNDTCTDKRRELMCFYYYNATKQIDHANASKNLIVFNEGFEKPLPHKELKHVMASVDSNKSIYGDYEGYYKISDKTIVKKLDLTEEEQKVCGFGLGALKQKRREEAKENTRKKKEERNNRIITLVVNHPELTYDAIAIEVGVSVRTVKSVLAEAGINRYEVFRKRGELTAQNNEAKKTASSQGSKKNLTICTKNCKSLEKNRQVIVEINKNTDDLSIMSKKCKKLPVSLKSSAYKGDTKWETKDKYKDKAQLKEDSTGQLYFRDAFKRHFGYWQIS